MIKFEAYELQDICSIIADTSSGLTGTQLKKLCISIGVEYNPGGTKNGFYYTPASNKRDTLYNGIAKKMNSVKSLNEQYKLMEKLFNVLFRAKSMMNNELMKNMKREINSVLITKGLQVNDKAEVIFTKKIKDYKDIESKYTELTESLESIGISKDVIEIVNKNKNKNGYYHSVFECFKYYMEKLRKRMNAKQSDITDKSLIDTTFKPKGPYLIPLNKNANDVKVYLSSYRRSIIDYWENTRNSQSHEWIGSWSFNKEKAIQYISSINKWILDLSEFTLVKNYVPTK